MEKGSQPIKMLQKHWVEPKALGWEKIWFNSDEDSIKELMASKRIEQKSKRIELAFVEDADTLIENCAQALWIDLNKFSFENKVFVNKWVLLALRMVGSVIIFYTNSIACYKVV